MMELGIGTIVSIAFTALLFYGVAVGVRTVPQGEEWIVERFGKFLRTLQPGLSLIIPFFDRVAYRVVTKDIVLDIDRQDVITRDNAVISTNAVAFIKVTDPAAAMYGVEDFRLAVRQLVQTSLRSIVRRDGPRSGFVLARTDQNPSAEHGVRGNDRLGHQHEDR